MLTLVYHTRLHYSPVKSQVSLILFCNLGDRLGRLRYLFLVCNLFFDKLPATDDGRRFATLFDVVVIEHQIDMYDGEEDEEPHQEMMNLPCHQVATHQRDRPGKQLRECRLAHLGVQSEARNALQQESPERTEVDQAGQGIMTDTFDRLVLNHQDIDLDDFQHFLPLRFLQRDEVCPAGKAVSHESPVQTEYEVEEEHEGRYKMDETDDAEPVTEIRFRSIQYSGRIGNDKSGNAEYNDTQCIYPVINTYGKLPYIYLGEAFLATFHSNTI